MIFIVCICLWIGGCIRYRRSKSTKTFTCIYKSRVLSAPHETHTFVTSFEIYSISLHKGWISSLTALNVQLGVSCQFDRAVFYSGERQEKTVREEGRGREKRERKGR